jgi:D-alanyl-D-alanine carboxypeptidase/D-alanyl-D-alanine-endopeptidase (penicillin-binding protein 4)
VLTAVALGACGGGAGHSSDLSPNPRAGTDGTPAISPDLARLRRALEAQLQAAGPNTGAMVYDLNTGQPLFTVAADTKRTPASVEKLYTTVALLDKLRPAAHLRTKLLGTGHLGAGGVWHGDLYLRGGGDPTFGDTGFNRAWNGGVGTTPDELVQQLRDQGVHRVTGSLIGDPSLFDSHPGPPSSGFAPDMADIGGQLAGLTYDHGATTGSLSPGAFAARQLALTMRRSHIQATAAGSTSATPDNAHPLAVVRSAPLSVLLRLMDVPSDDFYAEMLTKQLAVRVRGEGSTAAGAQVIASAVKRYGIHPKIVDGSGLSREDQSSPREVVYLLRSLWHTPAGHALDAALPLVGVNGTVRHIGVGTVARGRCIAKTGTLSDVTNLAGYCRAADHHELAFAVFLVGPSNRRGIALLSRMMAALVSY